MAEPILDIRGVPAGIHEMHGDRMTQYVGMPAVRRQFGCFRIAAKELVDR